MPHTANKSFELIKAAHERGRLAHAFLISGAAGSGKEQLASQIISLLNDAQDSSTDLFGEPVARETPALDDQEGPCVRIIRPKSKSRRISVAEIRDLESTLQLAVESGQTKIGVIADADRMNEQAENAFLKTLEEPPDATLLLLLTASPERLLPTILSRCVNVKLTGSRSLAADEGSELIAALNAAAVDGFSGPINALTMKAVFSSFLSNQKKAAEGAAKESAKEEIATYRDGTDGTWLKEREVFHKAAAEADYLEARNRYLDVILAWLADIIRVKSGAEGLDFPESKSLFEKIAETETLESLALRLDAMEQLRRTLETNAAEPLALEVGFLKAFS